MIASLRVVAITSFLLVPGSGFAQPFFEDPTPPGFKIQALFTGMRQVPGAATAVHCTNLGKNSTTMRVDFFAFNSANVASGSQSVAAGETRSFVTAATAFYGASTLAVGNVAGQLAFKVMSTGEKLMCTADMLSTTGSPPTFFHRLQRFDKNGR
jgi:hypothetical protein